MKSLFPAHIRFLRGKTPQQKSGSVVTLKRHTLHKNASFHLKIVKITRTVFAGLDAKKRRRK
jgi:hypothetical protein